MRETYIGKSVTRHDAFDKVTGAAVFAGDVTMSGMLYAKMKTSPHPHARIVSIDVSKAEALPGVRAVIFGKEADYIVGIYMQDRSVLAQDKVRYPGEAVAAVAADTEETAAEAVRLIDVVYEVLPPVLDVTEAIKPGTPLVHENLGSYKTIDGVFFPEPGTNIASKIKVRKGDVEAAFAKADVVIENTFKQPQVFHLPLETHAAVVQWLPGDRIKIHSGAQSPFAVRDLFAAAFGLSRTNIEVTVTAVGGGFGGKSGIHLEPLVGLLSRKAGGRPVKLVLTREEECATTPCRQGLVARIKTGVTKDGKIIAEEAEYLWDAGSYADYGVNIGRAGAFTGCGPYAVPNVKIDSCTIYTNHVYGTAYRGFGHPEVFFAIERQRDLLANAIGMDPFEFRMKNLLTPGAETITGELITENTGRVDKCLAKVVEAIDYNTPYTQEQSAAFKAAGKRRGKAAAVLQKSPAMPTWSATSAIVHLNEDGTVRISVGGIDMGQGTYTVLQQMAAEALKIPIEKVHIVADVHTETSPYDWQTVASRMTVLCGNALLEACEDLKNQIAEIACIALRAARHEVEFGEECVYVKQNPHNQIEFRKLAIGYSFENGNSIGGPIIGRGKAIAQGLTYTNPETGQGRPALDWTYGAHGVEIELDVATGDITILHIASCLDVGRVMNEMLLRGQVVGGVLQGLGTAFSEAVQYTPDGQLLTRNLTTYKIPTIKDIPLKTEVFSIETPQLDGPFGARGCGEHPLIGIAPVIANALANATGTEFYELPLSADNVLMGLSKQSLK
ncbi:MAG: xanthine dehydrogenase family protein molybdopterin-binding subunit [Defluviitaleaceae bacterium]|nr:xanthine dehydrogenase family protein molybdopterin-binding subunit [Defluviitaleaceae bacterium]